MIKCPQNTVPGIRPIGLRCPRCRSSRLRVLRTELIECGKRRQRKCLTCGYKKIVTTEMQEPLPQGAKPIAFPSQKSIP